jgi:hypothetical protein
LEERFTNDAGCADHTKIDFFHLTYSPLGGRSLIKLGLLLRPQL